MPLGGTVTGFIVGVDMAYEDEKSKTAFGVKIPQRWVANPFLFLWRRILRKAYMPQQTGPGFQEDIGLKPVSDRHIEARKEAYFESTLERRAALSVLFRGLPVRLASIFQEYRQARHATGCNSGSLRSTPYIADKHLSCEIFIM